MNNITTIGPNPYELYGDSVGRRHITGDLLKFQKGDYLAGQEGTEIPLGTTMIAIMTLSIDSMMMNHRFSVRATSFSGTRPSGSGRLSGLV